VIWGLIGEAPIVKNIRLVAEVSGEIGQGRPPDSSVLLGVIWQPAPSSVFLDAGVRRGISRGAPDWQVTLGLTFSLSFASSPDRTSR
jgi:hypothetical protein